MGIGDYGHRLKKLKKKNELRASNQAWFGRYATPVVLLVLSNAVVVKSKIAIFYFGYRSIFDFLSSIKLPRWTLNIGPYGDQML